MKQTYDVIVVGGGHAGLEAAIASAKLGKQTLLLTLNIKKMGDMPCNPSIGGSAKGIVVREIDALGGVMAKAADHEYLQIKLLNTRKGPGVQCLRTQEDKITYPAYIQSIALSTENLRVIEDEVTSLLHDDKKVYGVVTRSGKEYEAKAVILTTGTFMEAEVLVGHSKTSSGPDGEKPSIGLSPYLQSMGFEMLRLKTGTPPRIHKDTIDYSLTTPQPGMEGNLAFSYETTKFMPLAEQILCHLTYTTRKTHEIIQENLEESSMYSGLVKGVGPIYCPSIEDKIVRFADKPRHQLFLEPESKESDSIYLQGLSTSMPHHIQEQLVYSIPALRNAKILKYAYAIEYDSFNPLDLKPTLETKKWPGLYVAGQICGTSGYEEAAGLGLMAGINAVHKIDGKEPLILRRDQAYIGVMIDDLVTKGVSDPYRLLSSRAEYRLLLRHDNADLRLSDIGYEVGLISEERYEKFTKKRSNINKALDILQTTYPSTNSGIVEYLDSIDYPNFVGGLSGEELLRRPHVTYNKLQPYVDGLEEVDLDETGIEQLEIIVKYEGYIEKQKQAARRFQKNERVVIPSNTNYLDMDGLRLEAREKLTKVQPHTLGQASRISGVTPADITVLLMHIKKGTSK
ncbi:MAG: tRNA uridine-5-carboxymethylaminomethyl(34) synthesis enzyme MnmG [Erysipelotrichaceae bacterium]|nr:tRNA uridine-5-carboxymethylaminomethyl(34) synthesis enzyme MnmG [Erysipelotrichaceae bacterium]